MLDVHAPHEKIHGLGDFFLHLFTITVGLLIALGLEGCVEWQHHRHLVREARDNLRTEFRDNQRQIASALDDIHREQTQMQDDLAALEKLEADPKAKGISVTYRFSTQTLGHASWDTARETGAFAYMPYSEVKSYAELTDLEGQFNTHQERLIGEYTRGISFLYRFKQPSAKDADIGKSAEEGIRIALDIQSELLLCENIAQSLQRHYAALLQASA